MEEEELNNQVYRIAHPWGLASLRPWPVLTACSQRVVMVVEMEAVFGLSSIGSFTNANPTTAADECQICHSRD